jgi:predicted nucleotide-binding protein
VILSEQANSGRTIIEKFERNADVRFAIILLSPDDIGGLASDTSEPQPRARQNAILELGYFLGALGRQRVCPLVRGHRDLPSDVHGLVYVAFDGDAWKIQLVKELKAAGFEIDANLAF